MGLKVTNNAFGTLNAGITNSDTTVVLQAGQGSRFPSLASGDYFYATLIDTSNNLEIVKVTARSTDTMTIVRAQDNTTARAYSTNDRFELRPTAAMLNEVIAAGEAATAALASKVSKSGDTMTGSLTSNKAEILTTSGSRFNLTKTSVGNQHIIATNQGATNTTCKIHGFTFAPPSTETQAGIVFSENGADGTGIGMYTTSSYASGPQLGLVLEPDGAVLKPRHPAFYVQHTSANGVNQSNAVIILNTVQFDRTSSYNTSNGRYTAPINGCYQFFFGTIKSDNGVTPDGYVSRFRMRKNGTNFSTELRLSENGGYGDSASLVALVNLAKGDYVDVYITDAGGWYGSTYAHFGGYLIG